MTPDESRRGRAAYYVALAVLVAVITLGVWWG